MTKQTIRDKSDSIDIDEWTLGAVKHAIDDLVAKYGEDAVIEFITAWDGDTRFTVSNYRLETDEEYKERTKRLEQLVNQEKAQRYAMYEKLKKEFDSELPQ